jgi:hypothetical protein
MQQSVVDLNNCRDLLEKWQTVRGRITQGRVRSFAICILDDSGDEVIVLAGDYDTDPEAALRASMKMSIELTRRTDFKMRRR